MSVVVCVLFLFFSTSSSFHWKYSGQHHVFPVFRWTRLFQTSSLHDTDPEIFDILRNEYKRQKDGIELIASENFVSGAVLDALGSCFTNKYSEGLPKARYYGGNANIDLLESLCQGRALNLFNLSSNEWGVNVQPYSGSPANFAVYTALLNPHDRIMGLDLPSGGHLTHGYQTSTRKISAAAIFFDSLSYKVDKNTGLIDYDEMEKLVEAFRPKLLIAGASAYPRDWDYRRMRVIADRVNAFLMADIAHISGFVATGECNNPFPYCDVVTTTAHKSLRGPRSGIIFSRQNLMPKINNAVFPALQGGPHNHQIAALAVALKEAQDFSFQKYTRQVKANAKILAAQLQDIYKYKLVTNGTDNHLLLWDLTTISVTPTRQQNHSTNVSSSFLSGAKLEKLLEMVDISVNKNCVPGDISALKPSGIRLGTWAMTTRGLVESDMIIIAKFLHRAVIIAQSIHEHFGANLTAKEFTDVLNILNELDRRAVIQGDHIKQLAETISQLRKDVTTFAQRFPIPGRIVQ